MGTKTIQFCDLCRREVGVKSHSVVYGRASCPAGGRSEDVEARSDLCPACKSSVDWIVGRIKEGAARGVDPEVVARATLYEAIADGILTRSAKRGKQEP